MINATGKRARGFSLFELAVSLIILAVLVSVLLVRTLQYRDDAERQSVQRTVNVLRTALETRLAKGGAILRPASLAHILEENPFDWLDQKPVNYLGEYYSPELEQMPVGNWVFDRRDKTLVYLLSSHRNFSFSTSKFLKFKVEFAQAQMTGRKNGPKEVPNSFVIVQVSDQAGTGLE
jgi:prepilin-type N-terminal cleavage/methylation domain-containing protein